MAKLPGLHRADAIHAFADGDTRRAFLEATRVFAGMFRIDADEEGVSTTNRPVKLQILHRIRWQDRCLDLASIWKHLRDLHHHMPRLVPLHREASHLDIPTLRHHREIGITRHRDRRTIALDAKSRSAIDPEGLTPLHWPDLVIAFFKAHLHRLSRLCRRRRLSQRLQHRRSITALRDLKPLLRRDDGELERLRPRPDLRLLKAHPPEILPLLREADHGVEAVHPTADHIRGEHLFEIRFRRDLNLTLGLIVERHLRPAPLEMRMVVDELLAIRGLEGLKAILAASGKRSGEQQSGEKGTFQHGKRQSS